MELPWLGEHCSERTCKQLDFLPLKCNACAEVFCKDHIRYDDHKCSSAYKKNVQVPVCPLCNTPIPVQKGEIPDIVVGAHIDKDCKYNPAQQKQKIFTNKCLKLGCKRKEMMKVVCEQCGGSFCIKHRHPLDHDCKGSSQPISKAGYAALMRASHPAFQSPGAIAVPSNGNRQHNRYQLHKEETQTETRLVSTRHSSAPVTPLTALELGAGLYMVLEVQ